MNAFDKPAVPAAVLAAAGDPPSAHRHIALLIGLGYIATPGGVRHA